jgi:glucokinase
MAGRRVMRAAVRHSVHWGVWIMSEPVLALDIGGTKLAAALVDPGGTAIAERTVPTPPSNEGAEAVFAAVAGLLRWGTAEATRPVRGVGIGSAGPVDLRSGTVSPVNITAWRGFPLVPRVRATLPGVPVALAGDGICFTIGEHWLGAGGGVANLLGIVVSTGVGGGLVLGGRLFGGRSGNAGHVGHMVVDLDGPPCPCGGQGCVEALASGPSLVRWARGNGWRADDPAATARELAADARTGDAVAAEAFRRGGAAVAAGIVGTAATCELDRVVLGGGLARTGELLLDPVRDALRHYARLDFLSTVDVRTAGLPDRAGLLGAAALVLHPTRYPADVPAPVA